MNKEDVLYQASSLTFDPSLIEIFCAFHTGASLLILPQSCKLAPTRLNSFLIKHKVSFLQVTASFFFFQKTSQTLKSLFLKLTPTLYRNISEIIHLNQSLKSVALGGETFPTQLTSLKRLLKKGIKIYNLYGITELSCWSSYHAVEESDLQYDI